jgi:hypothetical protein
MDKNEKHNEVITERLKNAYNEIQPVDSWEALRGRIDNGLNRKKASSALIIKSAADVVFWRRTSLVLAACLLFASTLLIYVLCNLAGNQPKQITSADSGLLSTSQIEQLAKAFKNVRELFAAQSPWMVIDSGGAGEIGVDSQTGTAADTNRVIVIRLALNTEGRLEQQRYFDIVAAANQQVSFSTKLGDSNMNISLRPILTSQGKVSVQIYTQVNNGLQLGGTVTISGNLFTSLAKVRCDTGWVSINAVGQPVSNI